MTCSSATMSEIKDLLLLGDCREELKKLADNSIDLVFTSPPTNLLLVDLKTGNILRTLEGVYKFSWSPYSDLYNYYQPGETVNGIYPWGIFLGQAGKDPVLIKLEIGYPQSLNAVDWVDAESFVMNVGCTISLVSLAR